MTPGALSIDLTLGCSGGHYGANSKMSVNDHLELIINDDNDICHGEAWNRVGINCSPNASINISKKEISRGRSTKISNSPDDISCIITMYANDGKEISIMLYVRKFAPCDLSKI